MESPVRVRTLRFLINNLAVLRNSIDFDSSSRRSNGVCDRRPTVRFPRLAVVFGEGEVEVVVCARGWCFAHSP